jgi:hypothetical protein
MREIADLRQDLDTVMANSDKSPFPDRVLEGFRDLPSGMSDPFRWGFIGCWGSGGTHLEVDIHTTSEEGFFGHPDATDDKVAEFCKVFADPRAVRVSKYLFRHNGASRELVRRDCALAETELDAVLAPMIEAHLVKWEEGGLIRTSHNYVVTLMSMARSANDPEHWKRRRPKDGAG